MTGKRYSSISRFLPIGFVVIFLLVAVFVVNQERLLAQISVSGTDVAKIAITVHMCGAAFELTYHPSEITFDTLSGEWWWFPTDTLWTDTTWGPDRTGTSSGVTIENTGCVTLKFGLYTVSTTGRWITSNDTTPGVNEYVLWSIATCRIVPSPTVPGSGEATYNYPIPDSNVVVDTMNFISFNRFYNKSYDDTWGDSSSLALSGVMTDSGLFIPAYQPGSRWGDMFVLHFMLQGPSDDSHGSRWRLLPDETRILVDTVRITIIGSVPGS